MRFEISIQPHLFTDSCNCQLRDHFVIASRSKEKLVIQWPSETAIKDFRSSAKSLERAEGGKEKIISLMKRMNRMGPMTLP